MDKKADRTIITVVGKDTVGIIAGVCTYLAENGINVLDISQTIVQGFFNMMMIVDMNGAAKPFGQCAKELEQVGEKIGVSIKCQREEIFNKMHRISIKLTPTSFAARSNVRAIVTKSSGVLQAACPTTLPELRRLWHY
mgnify:CR=1 FL=1